MSDNLIIIQYEIAVGVLDFETHDGERGGGGGRVVDFCLRSAVLFSVLCEPSQDVLCFAGLVALVCSVCVCGRSVRGGVSPVPRCQCQGYTCI